MGLLDVANAVLVGVVLVHAEGPSPPAASPRTVYYENYPDLPKSISTVRNLTLNQLNPAGQDAAVSARCRNAYANIPEKSRTLSYGPKGGTLDLYMPRKVHEREKPSLVLYVHGGGWVGGSKRDIPGRLIRHLLSENFAVASVSYRHSYNDTMSDLKRAVAFLHAHGSTHGYDKDQIAIVGDSAGGHLALLAALTQTGCGAGGTIVRAALAYYPATDLVTLLPQSNQVIGPRRQALLEQWLGLPFRPGGGGAGGGGDPGTTQNPRWLDAAREASPAAHVPVATTTAAHAGGFPAPPIRLFHGAFDLQMPPQQSLELHGRYVREPALALSSELTVIEGAGHCDAAFFTDANNRKASDFLRWALDRRPGKTNGYWA